jgi:hypothetical protein
MQRVENLNKDITYLSLEELTKNISIWYILIAQIISVLSLQGFIKENVNKEN